MNCLKKHQFSESPNHVEILAEYKNSDKKETYIYSELKDLLYTTCVLCVIEFNTKRLQMRRPVMRVIKLDGSAEKSKKENTHTFHNYFNIRGLKGGPYQEVSLYTGVGF